VTAIRRQTSDIDHLIRQVTSLTASALVICAILVPLIPILVWSFAYRWYFPDLLPSAWSLRAWKYILSEASQAGRGIAQGGAVALAATGLSLAIGVPAGRALGLYSFRGKKLIHFLVLAPTIVPGIAVVMGIHVLFIKLGLTGTLPGVILVHLIPTTPYVTMVMTSMFANYNLEYEEQARTLGATRWRVFLAITLPAIFPGLLVGGMFAFIISWEQYILTLLIGSGQIVTLPVLLFSFAGSGNNATTAALCILFVAPTILILLLTSRYLTGENAALRGVR
jgi:putative spermidine/putrescine transport system permease protein